MSIFQFVSLRRLSGRIFWTFIGLAVLMLASGIGANILLSSAETASRQQLLHQRQVTDIKTLRNAIEEQRIALELIAQYNLPNGLQFLENVRVRADLTTQGIELDRDFPPGDETSLRYRSLLIPYQQVSEEIKASRSKTLSQADERNLYSSLKTELDRLELQTRLLLNDSERTADTANQNNLQVIYNTRWIYLVVALGLFLLSIVFASLIARLIARPLGMVAQHLRRIASGDLSEQMPTKGADEVVELSLIFNRTIANLKLAIARIQEQVGAISLASNQISRSSDSQATGLSEQAVAVSQVSATAVELSDTSEHIADSAALVAGSANNALESATEGYDTMLGASETMNEIRLKVNLIADRILALNQVAQRIREITLLIDTLSNETHLLALNAAIESAGAGEEGARFAVVAGHVRKLSQRSRVAAIEIQQLVNQIQHAAASSVMATEEGIKVVALGEKMVNDSLQANENIIRQIGQTTQLAQAISQATAQQRIASTQVADTMRQLSQISSKISDNSQHYLNSAADLEEVVIQLNAVVNAFVLEAPSQEESEDFSDDTLDVLPEYPSLPPRSSNSELSYPGINS